MSEPQDQELPEVRAVKTISWAIRRIAGGHYAVSDDERGRELWVNEFEPTLEEMEGELCCDPDPRAKEPLLKLKEHCTLANVRHFFDVIVGEKLGGMLADQFSNRQLTAADYPLVVFAGYRQLKGLVHDLQLIATKERGRLSVHWLESLEQRADPRAFTVAVLTHYAEELSRLFPEMLTRADSLRILATKEPVPTVVQRYLEEASECYIYGRFVACIILCRSAIEFALKDFLARKGQRRALLKIQSLRSDFLLNMIRFGRSAFPAIKATFDDADDIRRAANSAVHVKEPQPQVCIETFIKTRGVLGELYSVSAPQRV